MSVVIPCWNDALELERCLEAVRNLQGIAQVIVADASADETSAQIAQRMGATLVRCPKPNRGVQLNAGARAATGEILLFQHVDCQITQAHIDSLRNAFNADGFVGGAFYRNFDSRYRMRQFLAPLVRWYNRHGGALYGDQSFFVRRDTFERMGGFAEIPLMEDVEFSRRLRKMGRVLLDPPVRSSARRHQVIGSWRTTIQNVVFVALYGLGVSPHRLHRWYYRRSC